MDTGVELQRRLEALLFGCRGGLNVAVQGQSSDSEQGAHSNAFTSILIL